MTFELGLRETNWIFPVAFCWDGSEVYEDMKEMTV